MSTSMASMESQFEGINSLLRQILEEVRGVKSDVRDVRSALEGRAPHQGEEKRGEGRHLEHEAVPDGPLQLRAAAAAAFVEPHDVLVPGGAQRPHLRRERVVAVVAVVLACCGFCSGVRRQFFHGYHLDGVDADAVHHARAALEHEQGPRYAGSRVAGRVADQTPELAGGRQGEPHRDGHREEQLCALKVFEEMLKRTALPTSEDTGQGVMKRVLSMYSKKVVMILQAWVSNKCNKRNRTWQLPWPPPMCNGSGGLVPDVITWNTLLAVSGQNGLESEVSGVFKRMMEAGICPDISTYNAVLSAFTMGHVDHGKTTLLDCIRKSEVVASEAGGITQGVGDYQVLVTVDGNPQACVFLETPGLEAFGAMRARGARVTDICISVVAADEGVRPQTNEAFAHAKAAGVPIVIAMSKIDKEGANPEQVMQELFQMGLMPEMWGGDIPMMQISSLNGDYVDELLETVMLVAELQESRANPHRNAKGRFLLAAGSGRVLVRSFHSVVHVGQGMFEKALGSSNVVIGRTMPEMTWLRFEVSVMLENVQAHVASTDVDPGAGIQWLPKIHCRSSEVKRTGAFVERIFMPCQIYFRYTRHKEGNPELKIKSLKELTFNSPDITAGMTSRQFQVMMDVLTIFLFARAPRTQNISLSYPLENDDDDIVEEYDAVVPDGIEEVELAKIDVSDQGQSPKSDDVTWLVTGSRSMLVKRLKKELVNVWKGRKEASSMFRIAMQKAAQLRLMEKEKNKKPLCAMRVSMRINKVVWSMLADGKSFAEAEINDLIYDFDQDYKDIGIAQLTTKLFVLKNGLANAKSDTVLSPWNPPSEWGKNAMLRVNARQGAPTGGNSEFQKAIDLTPEHVDALYEWRCTQSSSSAHCLQSSAWGKPHFNGRGMLWTARPMNEANCPLAGPIR